ncbi:hypothetical protein HDK77DRAFT_185556 [Phyllosticta capitalensis]|uniref:uncharacterized protein n=1 Tax=Phyllosticta capitalensis TaxID=121624 RepID=UPI00312ED051
MREPPWGLPRPFLLVMLLTPNPALPCFLRAVHQVKLLLPCPPRVPSFLNRLLFFSFAFFPRIVHPDQNHKTPLTLVSAGGPRAAVRSNVALFRIGVLESLGAGRSMLVAAVQQ